MSGEGEPAAVRAFLDANVLFSAAYRIDAPLLELWQHPDRINVITSAYAAQEAMRNLTAQDARRRLERLIARTELHTDHSPRHLVDGALARALMQLPPKDAPILIAAVRSRCTILITGDRRHFGALYGMVINGVRVLPPADVVSSLRTP